MTSERRREEALYVLSEKINNLGGKYLDDKVLLDDLYNYSPRSGRARGNTPDEWNNVLANLDPDDKKRIMFAIGLVNRWLSKELGCDATVGDLRKAKTYQLHEWELSTQASEFIFRAFHESKSKKKKEDEVIEKLLAIANKVNKFCGANMEGDIRIYDLYFISEANNGVYECNTPEIWINCMLNELSLGQRITVTTMIGKFYRYLSKHKNMIDPTIHDLREINPEEYYSVRGIGPKCSRFVHALFDQKTDVD